MKKKSPASIHLESTPFLLPTPTPPPTHQGSYFSRQILFSFLFFAHRLFTPFCYLYILDGQKSPKRQRNAVSKLIHTNDKKGGKATADEGVQNDWLATIFVIWSGRERASKSAILFLRIKKMSLILFGKNKNPSNPSFPIIRRSRMRHFAPPSSRCPIRMRMRTAVAHC